jgi:AAA family ATP:ADP antiporter
MAAGESRRAPLERALRLFGDVRPGEAALVLLLLANIFLILSSYYVCKTAREPLILAGGGAEVKSYAAAGQALLLMGFVPLYGWFASRVDRTRLVYGVSLFFALNLELFWLAARIGIPYLGIAFFVWVGIFNNAIVAQFWSYANDIFKRETGERLFPVIAIGATLGSPVGAWAAERLFRAGVHAYTMLHVTAVALVVSVLLYRLVDTRTGGRREGEGAPLARAGGFALLLRSPYLRLIALLLLVLNLVNTTGEYILSRAVLDETARRAALTPAFDREGFIGAFYGGYFFWVNVIAVSLQALVASRLIRYAGVAGVLLALPVVALGSYGAVAAGVGFAALRWAKTAENATDYSIMNTARHVLWLPTRREEKYKAKQAADTFVVRSGDVLAAALVWVGTQVVGLGAVGFAAANIVLVGLWLLLAAALLREYRRLASAGVTDRP